MPVHEASLEWDAEAIANAYQTAERIEEFDPDAAHYLRIQAQAAQQVLQGVAAPKKPPYDPMALYARVLRFYQGAITDERLEQMDYRRFFGYLREADLMIEDEKAQTKQQHTSWQEIDRDFPRAVKYEGEVVKYER